MVAHLNSRTHGGRSWRIFEFKTSLGNMASSKLDKITLSWGSYLNKQHDSCMNLYKCFIKNFFLPHFACTFWLLYGKNDVLCPCQTHDKKVCLWTKAHIQRTMTADWANQQYWSPWSTQSLEGKEKTFLAPFHPLFTNSPYWESTCHSFRNRDK